MAWRRCVMDAQARVKNALKPYLFADERRIHRIRFGPGRGLRVHLNRRHDLQREFGIYESELSDLYRRLIAPDDVVYDVGAGDGFTSLLYARLAPRGHVYAFEPDPDVVAMLERNLAANPGIAPLVTVVAETVGGAAAPMSIDAFVTREPPPGFVKVDVDGDELEVLDGMRNTLRVHTPAIVVETHSAELERLCAGFLHAAGYGVRIRRNAWWRLFYPEMRPSSLNRWLVAEPPARARRR